MLPPIAYAIGIVLTLAISSLARLGRFDRDRVFQPTLTVAISSLLQSAALRARPASPPGRALP